MTITDLIDYLRQIEDPDATEVVLDDDAARSVPTGVYFITMEYVLNEWPSQPQREDPWPGEDLDTQVRPEGETA